VTVGITDYAQDQLGDVVYFESPEVGSDFSAGDAVGTIESVKAVSDIYTPVGGEVVNINEALEDAPELLNEAPFADGWMFSLRPSGSLDAANLLDAAAYQALVDSVA